MGGASETVGEACSVVSVSCDVGGGWVGVGCSDDEVGTRVDAVSDGVTEMGA